MLHTNTIVGLTPAVWRAARRLGVPVVHTLHDYHLLCARTTLLRSDGRLCDRAPWPCRELWRWKRRATTDVDVVTAPSRYVLDRHLAQGAFPAARTAVVPNAPEPLAAAPTPSPRVHGGGLFLGQLQVHKGVRELLGALAHVFAGPLPPGFAFEIGGA